MNDTDETREMPEDGTHEEPTAVLPEHDREQHEPGTHPVNVVHLVMGFAFALAAVVWALVVGDVVQGSDVRWLVPLPFLGAGAAGLVAATVRGRSRMAR